MTPHLSTAQTTDQQSDQQKSSNILKEFKMVQAAHRPENHENARRWGYLTQS